MLSRALVFGEAAQPRPLALGQALRVCACEIFESRSEAQFIELADRFLPNCFILMYTAKINPGILNLIALTRGIDRGCAIILFCDDISLDAALDAMRAGASDLLATRASTEEILRALRSKTQHQIEPAAGTGDCPLSETTAKIVGYGPSITHIREQILRAAASTANVLVTGESGTGKEVVAQLIHQNSSRRHHRFVALNCAAIPESLFESELFGHERGAFTGASASREGKLQHASDGTLFLDEIGDMPIAAQAKILRAIESRVVQRLGSNVESRVQARLVAATNQDLERLTQEKKFRKDLYFRLNVVRIAIPPLRERLEDIPVLVEHLVREFDKGPARQARQVDADVVRLFQQHDWPGNVRELRNVIESMLVLSSSRRIGLSDVPEPIRRHLHSRQPRYHDERSRILAALSSSQWNRKRAAEALHCSRMTLYRKMMKYSISGAVD